MKQVIWVVVLCLGLAGCQAAGVGVNRVAGLGRGGSVGEVEQKLGRAGESSCKVMLRGDEYEMVGYAVGQRGDEYLFVFRDGKLMKICRRPGFGVSLGAGPVTGGSHYLLVRANGVIDGGEDVKKPDDPPVELTELKEAEYAVGYLIAFSPFIVVESPVLVPMVVYDLIEDHAGSGFGMEFCGDPADAVKKKDEKVAEWVGPTCADVRLGETREELVKKFGEPMECANWEKGEEWVRYDGGESSTGWKAITIQLREGRVAAVFNQEWIDDENQGEKAEE